jgi:BirA family biotin operon repressor/biotin-[acetyl-CoA-carboxylase] ligase
MVSGNWKWAVAGLGININQTLFSEDLPNPVSLKQITGKNFDPPLMAKELCFFIEKNYQLLLSGGFQTLINLYQSNLYRKDETVKLKKGNRVFETTIKGVSENGQLITHHTFEERFDFGDVEWII